MAELSRWADAQRVEGFVGTARVNLIRLIAVLVFYGHHLFYVFQAHHPPAGSDLFHLSATALVVAWSGAIIALGFCLKKRRYFPALPYLMTGWDLLLITLLLVATATAGNGHSWLTVLYFLAIATTPLYLSLRLVYAATGGAALGYLVYLGFARFVLNLPEEQRLDRPSEIIVLLALGAAGLLAGQAVRQARRLVIGLPVLSASPEEAS
jgi:hypothetical protein